MVKKVNVILVLLLLFVSISAVSAADDINETVGIDEANVPDSKEVSAFDNDVLDSNSHIVNKTNYINYFDAYTGELKDSVNEGDTINLNGDFSNVNFVFKRSVNVVGNDDVSAEAKVTLTSDSEYITFVDSEAVFTSLESGSTLELVDEFAFILDESLENEDVVV